jgi:hypothetical protein
MLQKFLATGVALSCFVLAKAQDSAKVIAEEPSKPLISGYVDVYYRYNFANAKNVDGGSVNNITSFTNSQNSFELGMASVRLDHSFGKVSVVADLGFGKRAEDFSYNDDKTMLAIKQAYVSYAVTDKLKLSAGSWATHVGYELVDPYLNRNYSMSYMFSFGPFFHTGVKAEYTSGKSGFMVGILNPTDLKSANFQQKMIGAQYSYAASDKWKFYLNYIGGKAAEDQNLQQIDAVILGTITDKFSIGYNGTVQSRKYKDGTGKYGDGNSWWGSALYFNVDPTDKFGLTLRGEYMDDKEDLLGFAAGNVFATTLSANFKAGPLTFIPELRMDNADNEIFVKEDGAATKSTFTALLAAVYKF